jgi:hypothetical protein
MNYIGLLAAVSAFLGIWIGHVAVRKIEASAEKLWLPAAAFVAAGLLMEGIALVTSSVAVATAAGIIGITLLWDALELQRQEKRVKKGHAPANPRNRRHAAMLAARDSKATTEDLLKREPTEESPARETPLSVDERGIIY